MKTTYTTLLRNALPIALLLALAVPLRAEHHVERDGDRERPERRERDGDREKPERRERDGDRERPERREREENREHRRPKTIGALIENFLREVDEPEEREAIVREMRLHFRAQLREVEELLKEEMDEAHEMMGHIFRETFELLELKREQPEEYEKAVKLEHLDRKADELTAQCREAKGEAREALKKRLTGALEEFFDAKQAAMKDDIKGLEAEAEELRGIVERRETNRKKLIERRMQDLLEEDEMEW